MRQTKGERQNETDKLRESKWDWQNVTKWDRQEEKDKLSHIETDKMKQTKCDGQKGTDKHDIGTNRMQLYRCEC